MGPSFEEDLREEARELRARDLWRELPASDSTAPEADFTSSDYLGLARHPAVIAGAREALETHGSGARASRLLGGGSELDERVEAYFASWIGAEAALLFPTGYQANLGLAVGLAREGDVILSDERNHASTIDAIRLSKARVRVVKHCDLADLKRGLEDCTHYRRRFVFTEGVFSMDGDAAPLREVHELCKEHDAWLAVDEAHAVGIVGPEGRGAWARAESDGAGSERLVARVVTGGKALGVAGALVLGSRALRESLVQRARSFVFTTGIAPPVAGALLAAAGLARAADAERRSLRARMRQLCDLLERPLPEAAILPWILGTNRAALDTANRLQAEGLDVRAVRPPTVAEGSARLRIVLHAYNDSKSIERLARCLEESHPSHPPADEPSLPTAKPLFVVGTDTGIGKTVVSALICRAAAKTGVVTYWKPVQTGTDSDTEEVGRLCAGADVRFETPGHCFSLPASPHEAAAAEDSEVDLSRLDRELARIHAEASGTLVCELAGGLHVPLTMGFTQADFLARHGPRLALVARSGLGTLNHTLLTLEALRARGLRPDALFLVGDEHPSNHETLAAMGGMARVHDVPLFDDVTDEALDGWIDGRTLDDLLGGSER